MKEIKIPIAIQQLDIVLDFFNSSTAQPNILLKDSFDGVNVFFKSYKLAEIDNAGYNRILRKLIKDEYIKKTEYPLNVPIISYEITYEGMLMDQLGGYRQKYLDANRIQDIELKAKVNRKTVTFLTWVIAIGTAVDALYYGIEVYKYFSCTD